MALDFNHLRSGRIRGLSIVLDARLSDRRAIPPLTAAIVKQIVVAGFVKHQHLRVGRESAHRIAHPTSAVLGTRRTERQIAWSQRLAENGLGRCRRDRENGDAVGCEGADRIAAARSPSRNGSTGGTAITSGPLCLPAYTPAPAASETAGESVPSATRSRCCMSLDSSSLANSPFDGCIRVNTAAATTSDSMAASERFDEREALFAVAPVRHRTVERHGAFRVFTLTSLACSADRPPGPILLSAASRATRTHDKDLKHHRVGAGRKGLDGPSPDVGSARRWNGRGSSERRTAGIDVVHVAGGVGGKRAGEATTEARRRRRAIPAAR